MNKQEKATGVSLTLTEAAHHAHDNLIHTIDEFYDRGGVEYPVARICEHLNTFFTSYEEMDTNKWEPLSKIYSNSYMQDMVFESLNLIKFIVKLSSDVQIYESALRDQRSH